MSDITIVKLLSPVSGEQKVSLTTPLKILYYNNNAAEPGAAFTAIVLSMVVQIAEDSTFQKIVYSPSTSSMWGHEAENFNIASAATAGKMSETYATFDIPKKILQFDTTYYVRFFLDVVNVQVHFWDGYVKTEHRYQVPLNNQDSFKTTADFPQISFTATPSEVGEFGGTVNLEWDVTSNPGSTSIPKSFLKPITFKGFGSVSNKSNIEVFVDKTTTFTLQVSNNNMVVPVEQSITVKTPSVKGIVPTFNLGNNNGFFNKNTLIEGEYVSKVSQLFDVNLYTEYMQDIRLFVAYPWPTSDFDVTKIIVNPPDFMKNLIDESTQTVTIVVPHPGRNVPIDSYVPAAWGWDAIGKDGNNLRKVAGYFKLLG